MHLSSAFSAGKYHLPPSCELLYPVILACFLCLSLYFFRVRFWRYVSRGGAIAHTTILFSTEDILFVRHET
jgi:hypothetical protein